MPLFVVHVPDPPIGTDWQHVVPGKYLYNVTAITGTLGSSSALPPMLDSSGNGNTFQWGSVLGQDPAQMLGFPGAITGDDAVRYYTPAGPGGQTFLLRSTSTTMVWSGDFTVECWLKLPVGGNGVVPYLASVSPDVCGVSIQSNGIMRILRPSPDAYATNAGAALFDGAWHLYQWVFPFAAAVRFYRDGVQQTTASQTPVGLRSITVAGDTQTQTNEAPSAPIYFQDELAIYPSALSGVRCAAHFAAAASFATYTAAVLADAPACYYHLDETPIGGQRQVALAVGNGHQNVELIPTGFAVDASTLETAYSWQPKLAASAETASGMFITVPVPELILPAGYTIGSFTPDLGATDQWSNVVIWWDSALMDSQSVLGAFDFPPGAHLLYRQQEGGT